MAHLQEAIYWKGLLYNTSVVNHSSLSLTESLESHVNGTSKSCIQYMSIKYCFYQNLRKIRWIIQKACKGAAKLYCEDKCAGNQLFHYFQKTKRWHQLNKAYSAFMLYLSLLHPVPVCKRKMHSRRTFVKERLPFEKSCQEHCLAINVLNADRWNRNTLHIIWAMYQRDNGRMKSIIFVRKTR